MTIKITQDELQDLASPVTGDVQPQPASRAGRHTRAFRNDMLIPRQPSAYPYSVYLIGLGKGWIFENAFETYPIDVGTPNISEAEGELDSEEAAAELTRIAQLLTEHKDEDSSSAPDSPTPSP